MALVASCYFLLFLIPNKPPFLIGRRGTPLLKQSLRPSRSLGDETKRKILKGRTNAVSEIVRR